ncbi:hypothetical protein GW17_00008142 [Ensete ventricosum]|nr:hypothetical protein GW17_00008142 [Ensete ventricosum]
MEPTCSGDHRGGKPAWMMPLPALSKKGLCEPFQDLCPYINALRHQALSKISRLEAPCIGSTGADCSMPMARLLLLGLLLLDLAATLAVARPTPALDLGGPHSASAPSQSASPGAGESGVASAPEGAARIGKRHQPFDKSIAGAEVILGGLATAIFAAVFAYIRVTRKRNSENKV